MRVPPPPAKQTDFTPHQQIDEQNNVVTSVTTTQAATKTNTDIIYKTITVIDFETATGEYNSACSIGITLIDNGKITNKEYYLIQPPRNEYAAENVAIHGITPDKTITAPTFADIWQKIKQYFVDTYVAAHNAIFDMTVLKAALDYYNLPLPDFTYFNTLHICDRFIDGNHSRKLDDVCSALGIDNGQHHNASDDSTAAANLIIYAFENSRFKNFDKFIKNIMFHYAKNFADVTLKKSFKHSLTWQNKKVDINAIAATVDVSEEKDADFDGNVFVFTGDLKSMSREAAITKVIERGGTVKTSVSRKVDFLVNANPDGTATGKVNQALELQTQGYKIKIIDESVFLRMLADNNKIDI